MSYSIYPPVRGATPEEVAAKLAAAFDEKVLAMYSEHAHDRDAHLAAVTLQLKLLPALNEGEEYIASMNGWLTWQGLGEDRRFTGAGFGCSVQVGPKEQS